MKKLLFVMIVALLAIALVACGGEGDTTTTEAPGTTTEAPGTTTATTTTKITTTAPETTALYPGVDILNGEYENMAVRGNWNGLNAIAFEDHHPALNFRVALVFYMDPTENFIYEELFPTDYDTNTAAPNPEYKWVVTIDGEDINVENFSLLNETISGYVRMDLGDWTYSTEVDEDGYHAYDCLLRIYDSNNEIAYWAWFTDPEMNGPYYFKKADPITMNGDPNRDPSHIVINNFDCVDPLEGPVGMNADEVYNSLFDDRTYTKLCTEDVTSAIVWKFKDSYGAQSIVSYSLVGANDDENFPERVPMSWKLEASVDGENWTVIDEQNLTEVTAVNYAERNFKIAEDKVGEYKYFRLTLNVSAMWQISDILLYTET